MTTKEPNYWTHGAGDNARPHEWRYLGRVLQAYKCVICQMYVSKRDLKANTDA